MAHIVVGGRDDLTAALRTYEAIRQPRTAEVTRAAVRNTRMLRLANPLACAVRDLGLRLALHRLLSKQVRELASWSP